MKFVFFDVDWTLLEGDNKIHIDAFSEAFKKVYKIVASPREINYHGKTDTQIIIDVLKRRGLNENDIKNKLGDVFKVMIDYFEKNIDKKYIKILPGVKDCLDILEKRNVILGIVSGGLEKIVEIKLKIACIEKYFKLGAFGDFSEKRSDLVKYAIKKAEKIYREVSKKDIFIVGDTPLDIECGKVNGVKTIAIATGYYSKKDLLKYNLIMCSEIF